ncbi:HU family DNA-binding protein [Pelagovum pacificum]|uniref:DNA-binding protein n=1 Tax=Pelagovum pacificum TaxID=2588711 RepID=A0A5C5GB25_9RHOB|nr:HU family DNA-binding protein [Pelagovum pacificum]QQA41176.1 HU family DNA-binding protein [Pelagovum pacificum]TNY32015.1 DNA-binding protein [Pelagovum pacificum]
MATKTTKTRTTAAKTTGPKTTPTRKPAAAPKPTVVSDTPVVVGAELKKKDFIDRVVELSGGKKRDVKPAVEAALAVLGDAIESGEELNLPPLGKVKINREKDLANAKVFICRIRRSKPMVEAAPSLDDSGESPLADDGEDG